MSKTRYFSVKSSQIKFLIFFSISFIYEFSISEIATLIALQNPKASVPP